MAIKLFTNTYDIQKHFSDNVIANPKISIKLKKLKLENSLIVNQQNEKRPDLIANQLYNKPELSWVILFVNGMISEDLVRGTEIKYPSLMDLNSFLAQ